MSYKREGMTQEKLGKLYGFTRSTISLILPIYPNLKECANILAHFSNMDLINLARVENNIFREALVKHAKDKPSFSKSDLTSVFVSPNSLVICRALTNLVFI